MPNYRIYNTTDGRHIGHEFNADTGEFTLPNGYTMKPTEVNDTERGKRFVNSNYVIDAEPI
jgi:hypothetical protein